MLLLHIIILALVLSYGCAQIHLRQAQLSITRAKDKTARIDCEASGIHNFRSAVIHWYRHRPGEAPERILYISSEKVEFDKGSDKNKFDCENNPDQPISTLVVNGITADDSAIYYCAYWEYGIKHFGSGTNLVVSNSEAKLDSNKIQVLPSITEKDGQVTHICLIEDFYPDIIKVTWEDNKKNVEKNAVLGEIWSSGNNQQSYSISSWLTVDKNSNKNYRCNYQHEKESGFVLTKSQDTTIVPQTTADCTNSLFTVSFMHRTAYLIYIALLLKSTMYYVIVLFFTYRMQSPIKRQGEKS